jgi:hypothetical protein
MIKYAIRLDNQKIWFSNNKEIVFNTEQEAEQALIQEIEECQKAYELGYMEDSGDFDNYRIVETEV